MAAVPRDGPRLRLQRSTGLTTARPGGLTRSPGQPTALWSPLARDSDLAGFAASRFAFCGLLAAPSQRPQKPAEGGGGAEGSNGCVERGRGGGAHNRARGRRQSLSTFRFTGRRRGPHDLSGCTKLLWIGLGVNPAVGGQFRFKFPGHRDCANTAAVSDSARNPHCTVPCTR